MVACSDRKGFFAVDAHFAFPKGRQNVHQLQKYQLQRRSLCPFEQMEEQEFPLIE
jgi:hypothetical protein